MRVLALDTATELCSAALWLDGELRAREALAPRAHGTLLLPMIQELLAETGASLASLDAIAFGRGPGAFTGLRLAVSVAQGLGFSTGRPLIPVSDLRAIAAQALGGAGGRVLVCQDARMEEVYWGCFQTACPAAAPPATAGQSASATLPVGAAPPAPQLIGSEHVSPPAAVELPYGWYAGGGTAAGPIQGAGSGFGAYPALRERLGALCAPLRPELRPRAQDIARLAVHEGLSAALSPEQALPVYLRDRVTAGP
jgi:tRNA threonylcarbamoyladenosine biosynthesis protein TsaB